MANKVLSIKMEEVDIERLKEYHKALVGLGIVSNKTLSFNGLLKHLLLDNLCEDANVMVTSCCGALSQYINPEALDRENGIKFSNTYDFSEETFDIYREYIKGTLCQRIQTMKESVNLLNEVAKTEVYVEEGVFCTLRHVPREYEEGVSFWTNKALEEMDYRHDEFVRKGIIGQIEEIKRSGLSEDKKQKLIIGLQDYQRKQKENFDILSGRKMNSRKN